MGLLEALENFVDRLPDAMDGLRDLRREFRQTFEPLAKEGAELFTIGFSEMVLKNNNEWKGSQENRDFARQLVKEVRQGELDLMRRYDDAVAALTEGLSALDQGNRDCWEGLVEFCVTVKEIVKEDEPADADEITGSPWLCLLAILSKKPANPLGISIPHFAPTLPITTEQFLKTVEVQSLEKIFDTDKPIDALSSENDHPIDSWYDRVEENYRASKDDLAIARNHAKDRAAVRAYLTWECDQIESFQEAVCQVSTDMVSAGKFFMSAANELESWSLNVPPMTETVSAQKQGYLQNLASIASKFSLLLSTDVIVDAESAVNPLFRERLREASSSMAAGIPG